jgi:hypothetical protein
MHRDIKGDVWRITFLYRRTSFIIIKLLVVVKDDNLNKICTNQPDSIVEIFRAPTNVSFTIHFYLHSRF